MYLYQLRIFKLPFCGEESQFTSTKRIIYPCSLTLKAYLKDLHYESFDGFTFVNHSLTTYFEPTNLFRIYPILL